MESDAFMDSTSFKNVSSEKVGSLAALASSGLATASFLSTLTLIYFMTAHNQNNQTTKVVKRPSVSSNGRRHYFNVPRSTPLPGFGIFGDHVNGFLEILLDGLAIYVHNDNKWDCQRRLLCEGNQRASEFGILHSILMYFTSLTVSFWLRDQKVSESMEAMRKGRQGQDCVSIYPHCPFSI